MICKLNEIYRVAFACVFMLRECALMHANAIGRFDCDSVRVVHRRVRAAKQQVLTLKTCSCWKLSVATHVQRQRVVANFQ